MSCSHKTHRPNATTVGHPAPVQGGYRRRYRGVKEPRPNATTRGYDWEWRKIAESHREMFPDCQECGAAPAHRPNGSRINHVVDHIVPIRVEPGRRKDPSNLMTLCRRCHGWKTEADKKRYPHAYRKR